MKLHILSDLHLSVQGLEHPQTDADVVILAGDAADAAPFSPEDSVALHRANAHWLGAECARPCAGPTVVITHRARSVQSIHPGFAGSPINTCFVSDAEALIAQCGAQLWIHGHTHDSFDYRVGATRVLCNLRGYARDGVVENARFAPHLTVQVRALEAAA